LTPKDDASELIGDM